MLQHIFWGFKFKDCNRDRDIHKMIITKLNKSPQSQTTVHIIEYRNSKLHEAKGQTSREQFYPLNQNICQSGTSRAKKDDLIIDYNIGLSPRSTQHQSISHAYKSFISLASWDAQHLETGHCLTLFQMLGPLNRNNQNGMYERMTGNITDGT